MNRYELSPNSVLSPEQSKPDFFSTLNKGNSNDQENEDFKRGFASEFYQARRSEIVKNNQDLSIGSRHYHFKSIQIAEFALKSSYTQYKSN